MVKRVMLFAAMILFSLLAVGIAANVCLAQAPMPMMTKEMAKEAPLFAIQGTIEYKDALGGYYIRGMKPGGDWSILNKNPEILKGYMESKKTVSIEGTLGGPVSITIKKINGKEYSAPEQSK
jgi:hypothetical protein